MRSLFVKVFIWFWLAMSLSGLTLFVIGRITHPERGEGEPRPWHRMHAQTLAAYGMAAIPLIDEKGRPALDEYTKAVEQATGLRIVLLVRDAQPILDLQAPPRSRKLAAQASEMGAVEADTPPDRPLLAILTPRPDGHKVVVVAELPMRPPRPREPMPPGLPPPGIGLGLPPPLGGFIHGFGLATLVSCVIGGVVCLGLAWHLTAPIRRLRSATQRLAQGDLSARVGAAAGRSRDEVAALGQDFDLMAGRIQQLLARQQQLLRDISHELRSPLARLSVALELARQRVDQAASAPLDRIACEAERLNVLIGQLLTLTQMDSGELGPRKPVALTDVVEAVAADAQFEAMATGRSVQLTVLDHLTITGSEELLRRAIENVVRNAIRYTAEQSAVEIRVARETGAQGSFARVDIRDHGPGVPVETLPHLFLPFYRVADARERQTGGTGIGLAITERAVRLHGGTVEAVNADGGGLRISLLLPLNC